MGDEFQKYNLIGRLVLSLLALNLIVALFPVIPCNTGYYFQEIHFTLYRAIVYLASPIIAIIGIVNVLLSTKQCYYFLADNRRQLFMAILLTFCSVGCSLFIHDFTHNKLVIFHFFIFGLFLIVIQDDNCNFHKALVITKQILSLWVILPLALLVIWPLKFYAWFVASDHSFHGFADSHVGFGLWAGVLVILLQTRPSKLEKWTLIPVLAELLLSQSRSAVGALVICYLYQYAMNRRGQYRQLLINLVASLLVYRFILVTWLLFLGRQNSLSIILLPSSFDPVRSEIIAKFVNFIKNNWVSGYGGQYQVAVKGVGLSVPAHNIFLQSLANYGVFATTFYLAYLAIFFLRTNSLSSKTLFLFLIIYSMAEPVLQPADFLSPIIMVLFIAITILRNSDEVSPNGVLATR